MQFDVSISPCEMARRLEPGKVGTFESLSEMYISFAHFDRCNTEPRWDRSEFEPLGFEAAEVEEPYRLS